MSHDLERAFGDLADAAARAAEHGIVGEPSVGPTLTRLVTRVRRRRAAKALGAGALALALVGVTAGAVNAGLTHRTPVPPIESPTVTASPTPGPTTSATSTAPAGLVCGASDDALTQLDLAVLEPGASAPVAGITAPPITDTAVDQPLPTTFTIDNVAAEQMAYLTMQPRLVVVDADHVIVGWGLLEGGSRGPAEAGESTDAFMKNPLQACGADGDTLFHRGAGLLPAGDYGVWALVDATPLGGTDAVTATAGPFAVTLYEPSTWTPSADPLDAYFACGQAPTVREDTLPDVAGLMLAADVPADGWSSSAEPPGWTATLTGADERTVSGQAAVTAKLVFVGSDGLTAGMEVSGDFEWLPFSVSSGHPTALPAGGEPNRCEGGALASADIAMPPGTYTAWPVVTVSVDSVTHPDGSTDPAPTGDRIVVGFPTQVTFTD